MNKDISLPHPAEQKLIADFLSSFDEAITAAKKELEVSPNFKTIYNQALLSKQYGLSAIYGMALRKVFECLVKDFALLMNPDKEEDIARKTLANCIKDYIDSKKINALCTSCRLIGNNETHWRNDNTTEDVLFMEKVLKAILSYIEQEIVVLDAEEYYNKQKNKK